MDLMTQLETGKEWGIYIELGMIITIFKNI